MSKKNIFVDEFIGKEIRITASDCKSLVGKQGVVVNETKNMFIVDSNEKQLKLFKTQIHFKIKGHDLEIDGKKISKSSDERLKSNI